MKLFIKLFASIGMLAAKDAMEDYKIVTMEFSV